MTETTKLFMDGEDQAVVLPDRFRFEGTEVRISKVGDKVILEPLKEQGPDPCPFSNE
jgi:antitoxin VapB